MRSTNSVISNKTNKSTVKMHWLKTSGGEIIVLINKNAKKTYLRFNKSILTDIKSQKRKIIKKKKLRIKKIDTINKLKMKLK
jgi:hypothetical protein